MAFTINVIRDDDHLLMKSFCESGFGFFSKAGVLNTFGRFFLQVRFELFVGLNDYDIYKDENGTIVQSLVDAEGEKFAGDNFGDPEDLAEETAAPSPPPARRLRFLDDVVDDDKDIPRDRSKGSGRRILDVDDANSWRILTETESRTEACVVAAITRMQIIIPIIGGVNFGNAVAGYVPDCLFLCECEKQGHGTHGSRFPSISIYSWCFLPPEDTGVQCTPNGLFINVQTRLELVDGLAGALGSFIDSALTDPPTVSDPSGGGFTFGLYFDQSKVFQAVVFRVQPPTWSFFGIQVSGAIAPTVHLQWVKGAEVERRRLSILRTKVGGNWIPNCKQTGDTCNEEFWVPFYKDEAEYNALKGGNHKYEICEDLLLNVNQDDDKLLYYNRYANAFDTVIN